MPCPVLRKLKQLAPARTTGEPAGATEERSRGPVEDPRERSVPHRFSLDARRCGRRRNRGLSFTEVGMSRKLKPASPEARLVEESLKPLWT